MFNKYEFTATTATTTGKDSKTYRLKGTHFYCLQEVELKLMADLLFDKAYKQLEKALFFAVTFGVLIGMIIMSLIK